MIDEERLDKIKDFVKVSQKRADANHDLEHVKRVVRYAKWLAFMENCDVDIIEVAAWLHDVGQPQNKEIHGTISAAMAEPLLKSLEFDEDFINKVKHCIECHDTKMVHNAQTAEAKVLYDADKLNVIGPFGFARSMNKYLRMNKMKVRDAVKKAEHIQTDRFDLYLQTDTAKKLAKHSHEVMLHFYKLYNIWDKADLDLIFPTNQ